MKVAVVAALMAAVEAGVEAAVVGAVVGAVVKATGLLLELSPALHAELPARLAHASSTLRRRSRTATLLA